MREFQNLKAPNMVSNTPICR